MLTLQRLTIEGFGPYADRAVLEFPESGVTVIYGENGRGKTSLMKALRFVLLGSPYGGLSTSSGEEIKKPWILATCNRDLTAAGQFGFEARLAVRHNDAEWEIARSMSSRALALPPHADSDFTSDVSLRSSGYVAGPDQKEGLLWAMMPPGISRFFLFDGELLNQYAELLDNESEVGRRISDSIEQILGVPVLKNAREHLTSLASRLSREVANEASKDQETRAVGNSLKRAHEIRQHHADELERAHKTLDELMTTREEIETELRRQDMYTKAVERLDQARKDQKAAQAIKEAKAKALQAAMADAWRTVLDETVTRAKAETQKAMASAIDSLALRLRAKATETRHCEVCDQNLGEEVRSKLLATLPATAVGAAHADHAAMIAVSRTADLDRFRNADVRREVQQIWADIRRARMDEVDAMSRITDAQQTLEGRDEHELRHQSTTYSNTLQKIQAVQTAINEHEELIEKQDEAIDRLTKRLKNTGTSTLVELQRREQVVLQARDVFRLAVDRYKAALRRKVEKSATELFLRMTTETADYERLAINDHYGLAIVHKDGQEETGRSAGQEQVVALALIGALQANAPLRGPVVMDTPFGRLDPRHTANVVTALPTMAQQVVLFVQEGEIDRSTVRKRLGGSLKKEYELQRESARRTNIVEVK